MSSSDPIFLPKGFAFSAVAAGIKASGKLDLGLITSVRGTTAAAMFTKNLVTAAPVEIGRRGLKSSAGHVRAVLVNSGNANCATGTAGVSACRTTCAWVAKLLKVRPAEVFPSSTGIIGVPLPGERIETHLPALISGADASVEKLREFADAILTTDKRAKIASMPLQSGKAVITGIAKGSGMIHPQMATMLVYLLTDIRGTPAELKSALRAVCDDSFNVISVDGDTSTNDTALLLASGQSGLALTRIRKEFQNALLRVCRSLAEQIVADGEGVQHLIRLRIDQARNRAEALQIARTIAHSLLVKTAWAGADPNWGRILAAVGRASVQLDPAKINISIGSQLVCRGGMATTFDHQTAHQELSKPECRITVHLGRGKSSLDFLTADLTSEYVAINALYST
jgi:glutamate N-acetyltransferase/amino-acid N-acetyltransferase